MNVTPIRPPIILLSNLLIASICPAQFTTVINVPPDPSPTSIGSDTQLNVFDGGTLPSSFESRFEAGLADGSSSNIEVNISGGMVGDGLMANAGSEVNISAGTVGHFFIAESGSFVTISGGAVGTGFAANAGSDVGVSGGTFGTGFWARTGSHVTISGGSFADYFQAESGSRVTISGGTFGPHFFASGSDVTLLGGEFLLNGFPPTGSTVALTVFDLFTGTLADGSPFIFSGESQDAVLVPFYETLAGVTLAAAPLPAIDVTPILVDGQTSLNGLRQGQTLTLAAAGEIRDNFAAVNATLEVRGGRVGNGLEVAGSQVVISGGNFGSAFKAYNGSEVSISGGTIGSGFGAHTGSNVTISGGTIGQFFRADADSQVTISGGEYLLNGVHYAGSTVELTDDDVFTGTLADGSPFIFSVSPSFFRLFSGPIDSIDRMTLTDSPMPPVDVTPLTVDSSLL